MLDTKAIQNRIADLASSFKAYLALTQKERVKLTKTDKRRIEELEKELYQILEPKERSDLIVDLTTVARFFGVSIRQVNNWVTHKGCPKLKHGVYDLKAVQDWWFETIVGVDTREIEDVKLKYWKWKAEGEKQKVEEGAGKLVAWDTIDKAWSERVGLVCSGLALFRDRLPPLLEGRSQAEMRQILDREVRLLRENYAREGRYTPK